MACVVVLDHDAPGEVLGPAEDRLDRLGMLPAGTCDRGSTSVCCRATFLTRTAWSTCSPRTPPAGWASQRSPDGIAGFATAFQLATRAAETLTRGESKAVSVTERLAEVLLAGSPQVTPLLMAQTLGPLLAQPEAQATTLVDTLGALLRHDGSPTHAAEELFCHRNTVIYRMKQIEQLTGRSLTDPRDKMLLGLALMSLDPRRAAQSE